MHSSFHRSKIFLTGLFLVMSVFSAAAKPEMRLGQNNDGFIAGWAVLGPFVWTGSEPSDVKDALLDKIKTDGLAVCEVGSVLQGQTWQYVAAQPSGRVDMLSSVSMKGDIEAYAMCIITPEKAGQATFYCGSDDGIQIWIDGKEVYKKLVMRGWDANADKFTVDLPAKPIACLVRSTQGGGDWAVSMRITDDQNNPLKVNPIAYLNPDAKAFLRPTWDKQTQTLDVAVTAFVALDQVRVCLESSDQKAEQTVSLTKLGDLKKIKFPLPWMSGKAKPEIAKVSLYYGIERLAHEQVILLSSTALSQVWLDGATDTDDPWKLERQTPYDPQLADAFLGNGYYGIRVASEGSGATYGTSRTNIGGIYKDGARVDHPRWFAVDLLVDGKPYRPAITDSMYSQTLDMKQCRLTTRGQWQTSAGPVDIRIDLLPHRTVPHLLVMKYELTASESQMQVTLKDMLDASQVRNRSNVVIGDDPLALLSYQIESIGLTEVAAVCWTVPQNVSMQISQADDAVLQILTVNLQPGKPVELVRYAALHTSFNTKDPIAACRKELSDAKKAGFAKLADLHTAAWKQLWNSDILVPNARMQQMVHSALFQSYCNLREDYPWSVGPVGLSGNAWEGRVFWDADLWVFPPLALLNPSVGRAIVEYRYNTLKGAITDAKKENRGGAKFAWESADDGIERCPWPPAIEQRHIQNDVAFAQWQYYLCTGDEAYLKEKALPVITASADYWVDRVTYNAEKDRYEILHVLGPDEYAENINNNTTTNYGAAWTLKLAAKLNEHFGKPVRPQWNKIAEKMYLPFDEKNQRYMQHDNYKGEQIKQADTTLSIYPFEMPMSDQIKRNDLDFYPNNRPAAPIMMSSAIYSIAFAEINDRKRSCDYFSEMTSYFWQPFLLTSESPNRGVAAAEHNTISFITGSGGYLQTFLNGFAGIRIREDGLLVQPALPDSMSWLEIKGVHYKGKKVNIRMDGDAVKITPLDRIEFRVYDRGGRNYSVTLVQDN